MALYKHNFARKKYTRALVVRSFKRQRCQAKLSRNTPSRPNYSHSPWGKMLSRGHCQDITHKDGQYFQRQFRIPFSLFNCIVLICREYKWFNESHRSTPLELKILATLHKLGHGGCFNNLYDSCGISDEVLRVFYHKFC